MSDPGQGSSPGPPAPDWWLASDGNWYPPQPPQPQYPQPPQYPGAPPSPYGGYYPVQQRTNGMAVASLVLGILWLYWVGSILALIFGYAARGQIDRAQGMQGGRGLATAGIVLGWIGVGLLALVMVVAFASVASEG